MFESSDPDVDATGYVEGAVAEMRGCKHPDDPEFSIDPNSVKVVDLLKIQSGTTVDELIEMIVV